MEYFAIILADDECTTVSIFSDPSWWEWLQADNMPRDGETRWELPLPTSLASLAAAYGEEISPNGTVELTVGSFENDKAQRIAGAIDGPGAEPFEIEIKSPKAEDDRDNDAWTASARKSVLKWAKNNGHTITEDHIYEGLWY